MPPLARIKFRDLGGSLAEMRLAGLPGYEIADYRGAVETLIPLLQAVSGASIISYTVSIPFDTSASAGQPDPAPGTLMLYYRDGVTPPIHYGELAIPFISQSLLLPWAGSTSPIVADLSSTALGLVIMAVQTDWRNEDAILMNDMFSTCYRV